MSENKASFETNLKELEEIVHALEDGNVSLEQMLELFEKGIALTRSCTNQLDKAEQKINILVKRENGEMTEEEFEGLKEKYKDIARCDEDVLSLALFEQVATEFLTKKYNPEPEVEVDSFDMYI